jgi:hypothetical protein
MKNTNKKEIEEVAKKEPTIQEQINTLQEQYGETNRKTRRTLNKLLNVKGLIKGTLKPYTKGQYTPIIKPEKINALCKNSYIETNKETGETKLAGCLATRANGNSRCAKCGQKYHEKK